MSAESADTPEGGDSPHEQLRERRSDEERRAHLWFRSLLDHANDTIEVLDPQTGRFLDVNERACRDHGFTRDE